MKRVIDAAVAVKWFIKEKRSEAAIEILSSGALLYAPQLILIEVGATFMKKVRRQEINADFARSAERTFRQRATSGLLTLWPDETLLPDAIELSLQLAHPLYDCLYLALAQRVDAPLVTPDMAFLNKLSHQDYKEFILAL